MAATNKRKKIFMWVCFTAYLLFLSYLLFFSSHFGRTEHGEGEYRYNLTLFQEIGRYVSYGIRTGSWYLFFINVCGNVAVFIPIGLFLPVLIERCKNVFLTVLLCLEISLAVEVTQILSRVGTFDVDDLLLNTLGGVLGYIIFVIWNKHRNKTDKKETKTGSRKTHGKKTKKL